MENELIRRSDVLNCSHIVYIEYLETDDGGYIEGDADCIPVVKKRDIESIPAVDAVEVRHGEWEEHEVFPSKGNVDMLQSAFCPVCQRYHTTPYSYYFTKYNYCPWCGAKMDGRREDGDE